MAGSDARSETRSRLSQYRPGSFRNLQGHRFTKVSIQLFGMAGHGKSSLINSCLCVMGDEAYLNVAGSGGGGNPNTMERREYRLLDNVYITDNRGVVTLNLEELHEMTAQMGQLRKLEHVEWGRGISKSVDVLFDNFRNPPSEILLPVFVYRYRIPHYVLYTDGRNGLSNLGVANNKLGSCVLGVPSTVCFAVPDIFPVIVLTRSDNPKAQEIRHQFKLLNANFVIPLENYTCRNSARNPETDGDVLKFLDVCLKEADRSISLKMHKDPREQVLQQFVREVAKEMEDKDKEIKELTEHLKNKQGWWSWLKSKIVGVRTEKPI